MCDVAGQFRPATAFDEIWTKTCPECGSRGFVAGDQTGEDFKKEHDKYAM